MNLTEMRVKAIIKQAEDELSEVLGKKIVIDGYKIAKQHSTPGISIDEIKDLVCYACDAEREFLESKTKTDALVFARYISIFFIRKHHTGISLKDIGKLFGGRDHSTVIHAKNTHDDLYGIHKNYTYLFKLAEDEINQHLSAKYQTINL